MSLFKEISEAMQGMHAESVELTEAKHKWKVKIDDKIHGGEWEVEAATEKGALSSVYRQMRLAKHAQNDLRNRRSVTVTKVGTNESVELDEANSPIVKSSIKNAIGDLKGAISALSAAIKHMDSGGKRTVQQAKKEAAAALKTVQGFKEDVDFDADMVELDEASKYGNPRHPEYSTYVDGRKSALKGVKYEKNPHSKGSDKHLAWASGHNDWRSSGKNNKKFAKMQERAAWVPESIADEQVEAFMEAALDAVSEGDESFVFEGKSYKVKGKKEGMDKVNPKALNKDFDDREDKDIDNDGDEDESDEYLHNRRKSVKKAMKDDDESMDENKRPEKQSEKEKERLRKKAVKAYKDIKKGKYPGVRMANEENELDEAAVKQPDSHNPPADTIKKQVGKGRTPEEDKLLKDHPVESEDENDGEKVAAKSVDNADGGSKKGPLRRGDRDVGASKSPESLNKAIADAYAKVRAKK